MLSWVKKKHYKHSTGGESFENQTRCEQSGRSFFGRPWSVLNGDGEHSAGDLDDGAAVEEGGEELRV